MKFVPKTILKMTTAAGAAMAATLLASVSMVAAPQAPPPPTPDPTPPGLPLDSGIVVLMIAATLLGCYKIYQITHKKAQR